MVSFCSLYPLAYVPAVWVIVQDLANEAPFRDARCCELLPDVRRARAVPPFDCISLESDVDRFLLSVIRHSGDPVGIRDIDPVDDHALSSSKPPRHRAIASRK